MRASWRRFAMSWAVIPNLWVCNLSRLAFGKHEWWVDGTDGEWEKLWHWRRMRKMMALMEKKKNDSTSREVCALRRVLFYWCATHCPVQLLKCSVHCAVPGPLVLEHGDLYAFAFVYCFCLFVCCVSCPELHWSWYSDFERLLLPCGVGWVKI